MPRAGESSSAPRLSQRRPLACQECTRRKRKCDKKIPCSRCQRLNLNCSVETVRLRRDAVQHASEIQFLETILGDLDSFSTEKLPEITQKLKNRITRLQTGGDSAVSNNQPEQSDNPDSNLASDPLQLTETADGKQLRLRFAEAPSDNTDPPLLTAIEHLAWGRNSAGCYPHRRCGCQYRRDSPEFLSTNSASFQIFGSALESMVDFPRTTEAQKLIKFHVFHLAWHHNCFHGPTFLQQCEVFWTSGRCDHPLWIALYFSVLSCTINSIQNSHKLRSQVDVNLDAMQTTQQLFSAMVQTMYSSHFLNNISIYSVQAVVISTEVAHNLGLSQLNATLFNAAVRIAECLGLHKIKDHPTMISPTRDHRDQWEERIEREVGRRVWCQMIIQDHFAIPFTDTYSISPMHYSTNRPMNADDYNLVEMPVTTPTISTYVRVLVNLAALMPDLCDGLGPMNKRKTTREQYERILQVDQKMRTIVQNIPSFLLRPDKPKEAQIPWLRIARRSLAITAAEKIIMVHRPFLFHSFNDPKYTHTRRTCVAAAMTILREHETIVEEDDLSIWTHSAFAITAAVILCFEVNSLSDDPDNGKKELYRDAVLGARDRLASRHSDVLAQRGVALVDAIFISEGSTPGNIELKPGMPIDFNRIFANFSTLSKMNPNADADDMSITKLLGNTPEGSGSAGFDADEMALAWNQEDIDFDAWFNGVFNTLQTSPL